MTVFYAYANNIRDDNTWRLILTFASRYVADEFWRVVSTDNSVVSRSIQRVTPQFYSHDPNVFNLVSFFYDGNSKRLADNFRGRMFITLDNDRGGRGISIIPPQDITDHVSGNSFYLRSKSNPDLYWHYDPSSNTGCDGSGSVRVSSTERTRFRITAPDVAKGAIMIGTDRVNIYIGNELYIGVDNSGRLGSGKVPRDFKFSELLEGRFAPAPGEPTLRFLPDDLIPRDDWVLA